MAIWLDAFCNHDFPQAFGKKCAPRGVKLKPAQLIRASRTIRAARVGEL